MIRTCVSIEEGGMSPLKLKMAVKGLKGVETSVEDIATESEHEP